MNKLRRVKPTIPIAPYVGGKIRASKHIIPIIDRTPHKTYAEPFVGMGGIFLRRTMHSKCEVINDYNRDLINLFRILQRHHPQFVDMLRFQISSRAEFERLKKTDPETLTDLERAARFLYIQRLSFGGKILGTFGISLENDSRFNFFKLEPMLKELHLRFSGVVIECLDWSEFITRHDLESTFFYLDPPYWGAENDYGKDSLARDDFEKMASQLKKIKGKFLLSINDIEEIKNFYDWANIQELNVMYSVCKKKNQNFKELLISNFDVSNDQTFFLF